MTPTDIAQGISGFAAMLRQTHSGKNDEMIKRWLLVKFGYTFSRRKDCWEKEGKEISPYTTLEEVILEVNYTPE